MKDDNKSKYSFKFGITEIVIFVCTIIISIFINKIVISMNGYYYIELPSDRTKEMILIKEFKDKKVLLFRYKDEKIAYSFFDENATLISNGKNSELYNNSLLSYYKKDDNLSFMFKDLYQLKEIKYLENNWSKK